MEKNCIWHFKPEGGGEIGPNDPLHITFRGSPYYSIVREAIQNSLDAVNHDSNPVKVSFQYFELNRLEFPSFFKLEEHINQSLKYYNKNEDAKRLFDDMLEYLNGVEEGKKKLKISCLRVSDINTKGMYFDENTTDSPFYAFLRASGVSSKNLAGSGGSFGFGKGAYFALSPLKTLIVSSKDINGNVLFEGTTRLTTHKDNFGIKLSAYGFYDNNNGNPTIEEDDIPEIFKRTEPGTDVNIIGLWDEPDRRRLMIKSVLNNFWLAIYGNKLVVQIDDVVIDKNNLEEVIEEYFRGESESGTPADVESWNPKSYLKAVKYSKRSERFRIFEGKLKTIGDVKLYVYLEKGLANRTSYFRKPKMVVFKRTNRKVNGYSAVFICENEAGNEILRLMENPAHSEWKKENYPQGEGKIHEIARKAESEVNEFVNSSLDSLSKIKAGKEVTFVGLEEYLFTPEDLLEKEEAFDSEGNVTNLISGDASVKTTNEETGLQTTYNKETITIKPTIKTQSIAQEDVGVEVMEEGEETIATGGENETNGGNAPSSDVGDTPTPGSRTGQNLMKGKVIVNVKFNIAAQREDKYLYHYLIVTSKDAVENAELKLLVGADNDRDDGIEIVETDNGVIFGNAIKNLRLERGVTKIKIRFADNVKHSVKLQAYEIQ